MSNEHMKKEGLEAADGQLTEPTDWDALHAMRDEDIDTSDIPVVAYDQLPPPGTWLRPVKQQVTMRLDVSVLRWFKENATDSYQAYINRVLKNFIWKESGVYPVWPAVPVPVRTPRGRPEGDPTPERQRVAESAAAYTPSNRQPVACGCGCGEFPRSIGSTYLPGHDTRMYPIADLIHAMYASESPRLQELARQHRERVAARERGGPCLCGCGVATAGKRSRFIVGHDARYRAHLLTELRAEGA